MNDDFWEKYTEYINSDVWKLKRREKGERVGWKCECCGRKHELHVHHKRYPKVFGTEKMKDLEVLCIYCHAMRHREKIWREPWKYGEELQLAVLPPDTPYLELAEKMNITNKRFVCEYCKKMHSPKYICEERVAHG